MVWCRVDRPGALVEDLDDIAANAVRLARTLDSVCLHGDSPGAVDAARAVRTALTCERLRGRVVRGPLVRARRLGPDAVLVECADALETGALHSAALRECARDRLVVRDLVPAARTVLFDGVADPVALAAEVVGWALDPEAAEADR